MKIDSSPDWNDLRYFLAAARAKTLVGAARALGVEHTTVGRRLSALERTLGAPLVLRGSEGLRLTALGERLVAQVEEMERAASEINKLARSEATRVRVAVPSGLSKYLTDDLPKLCSDHPDLALELMSGANQVDLASGEADIALRSGPISDKSLVARKLCDAGFSVYASESYLARRGAPLDLDDLRGHELVAYHESLAGAPSARWLEARAAGATIVLRSRELTDMLTAAVAGLGLAVLPCSLADAETRLKRLTPQVVASRPLWLVHRREVRLSKAVRAVMRFIIDVIGRHAAAIEGVRRA